MRVAACLTVALLVAGCAAPAKPTEDPVQDEAPEKPVASIMVAVGVPQSILDEYRFEFNVTGPDNVTHWGAMYLRNPEDLPCWLYQCPQPPRVEGELEDANPEGDATYPVFRLDPMDYLGNWTLTITRISSSTDDPISRPPDHCAFFIMGEPNGTLAVLKGDPGWKTPDCLRNGSWTFDYPAR